MKLKPFVFPFLYLSLIFTLVLGLYFTSNALTKDVVLTESIDSNITGNPIAAGMIVDIIEKDTFDNIYRSLFSEEPSYEFSELAHIGCPAPTTMDNTTHKMYLVHACGGPSTTIYRNNITSITSDKEF